MFDFYYIKSLNWFEQISLKHLENFSWSFGSIQSNSFVFYSFQHSTITQNCVRLISPPRYCCKSPSFSNFMRLPLVEFLCVRTLLALIKVLERMGCWRREGGWICWIGSVFRGVWVEKKERERESGWVGGGESEYRVDGEKVSHLGRSITSPRRRVGCR